MKTLLVTFRSQMGEISKLYIARAIKYKSEMKPNPKCYCSVQPLSTCTGDTFVNLIRSIVPFLESTTFQEFNLGIILEGSGALLPPFVVALYAEVNESLD